MGLIFSLKNVLDTRNQLSILNKCKSHPIVKIAVINQNGFTPELEIAISREASEQEIFDLGIYLGVYIATISL